MDQAKAYGDIRPEDLVRGSRVTVPSTGPLSCQAVYVCLEEHVERILIGIGKTTANIAVLSLDQDQVAHRGAEFDDIDLQRVFDSPQRFAAGAPPRYVTIDAESSAAEFDRVVLAALVVELSHARPLIDVPVLAHNAIPYLAMYGEAAKTRIIELVGDSTRRLALADPESFRYSPSTETRRVSVVEFLREPEDADVRGRTQSYQAISRAAGRKPTRRLEVEGQQNMDELVAELDRTSESADAEDNDDDQS